MTLTDCVAQIDQAISLFWYGERYIEEKLDALPFDEEGNRRAWYWFDLLWSNVYEFLRIRFPELGSSGAEVVCSARLASIREMIQARESEFRLYQIIASKYQPG